VRIVKWEEREVRKEFGVDYYEYAKKTQAFIPRMAKN
jgi:protein-S-isoprenylcysteine O-methyltransferase Ste14